MKITDIFRLCHDHNDHDHNGMTTTGATTTGMAGTTAGRA